MEREPRSELSSTRPFSGEPRSEVSSTRLYLGNMPPDATKEDVKRHFTESPGEILDIKLLKDFAFIEYTNALDARDVVPMMHGSVFMDKRLIVQFAKGDRPRGGGGGGGPNPFYQERQPPRTRRTVYRMTVSGLPLETSWQDLKDFARLDGLDVVYSEVAREKDGNGFVEYETEADLKNAVDKIDGREFRGSTVQCAAAIQAERPRDRFRSRSPPPRRGGYGGGPSRGYDDYHERRGPPRGYSPRGYRERTPPPSRGYRDERYGRSPPPARGRPPMDDYPPPRRAYPDDGYGAPPPRGGYGARPPYEADPYLNGRTGYDKPPSPRRARSPPRGGYGGGYGAGYDRRGDW